MKKSDDKYLYYLIGFLCVLVLILISYIFYDKVLSNKNLQTNDNLIQNNAASDENIIDDTKVDDSNINNSDNNNNANNNSMDEKNFIRDTRVVLIEESCTGDAPMVANIESDGNISISQSRGAVEIKVGNAKYLYRVSMIACNSVQLYYITNDNELYVVNNPSASDVNQTGTKVTESKIVEFLGVEGRDDGSYLKVLNINGTIEYIQYFVVPN